MIRTAYPYLEVGRLVNAPPQAVWDVLTDTWQWVRWGPSISVVQCAERYIRRGSKGRVRTVFGLWLPFVINDFEFERCWSWQVAGFPATGHRVEPAGRNCSLLVFQVPVFAAPYLLVCKIAMDRIARMFGKNRD